MGRPRRSSMPWSTCGWVAEEGVGAGVDGGAGERAPEGAGCPGTGAAVVAHHDGVDAGLLARGAHRGGEPVPLSACDELPRRVLPERALVPDAGDGQHRHAEAAVLDDGRRVRLEPRPAGAHAGDARALQVAERPRNAPLP